MTYIEDTSPPSAPNERGGFRCVTMPRRPHPKKLALSPRIIEALRKLDINCDCKCSLIVSCAVGAEPGCRERRREGSCSCRPRWLPRCILEAKTAHGCSLWREGKTCNCKRLHMPRCLVTGCEERRRGHRCECPRTPTDLCRHVQDRLKEFADLTPDAANRMADVWSEQLWILLPEEYRDRPLADTGCQARVGDSAVALMTLRESMGRSLWHPDDERYPDGAVLQRQAFGLKRLLGIGAFAGAKGGVA